MPDVVTETGRDLAEKAAKARLARRSFEDGTVSIAFVGEFGTTAKSTTAVTYAAMLAQLGFLVDLFDLDGQGDASKHCGVGVSERDDDNLLDLSSGYQPPLVVGDSLLDRSAKFPDPDNPGRSVTRKVTLADVRRSVVNEYGIPGFGVIPDDDDTREWLSRIFLYPNGDSYVTGERIEHYRDQAEMQGSAFGAMLLTSRVKELDQHLRATGSVPHFRLYDTHGTKSQSMVSALLLADSAVTTVVLDDKTTGVHLDNLYTTIRTAQSVQDKLRLAMILVCRVRPSIQRGRHGQEMLDRLRARHGDLVCDTPIREKVTVGEAYRHREPLPMWVPNDTVTDDYWTSLAWAFNNHVFD